MILMLKMKRDLEVGQPVYLKKINPMMKELGPGLSLDRGQREEQEDLIEVNQDLNLDQDLDLEIGGGEGVDLDH